MQVICIPSSFNRHKDPYFTDEKPRLREVKSVPDGDTGEKTAHMERLVHKMAQGMKVFCELGKG